MEELKMLDVFIEGELVDLAIPTEDFAAGDTWYKWFNDKNINKYLEQGLFPNTQKSQILKAYMGHLITFYM